jgi:spore germination cell wall hydrolase CwlJ-like protein
MIARPYSELTDRELLWLCVWREARGEGTDGQRGVAHVIRNRTFNPEWYNRHTTGSYRAVILFPAQFSSFSPNDPNGDQWPSDSDMSFLRVKQSVLWVPCGVDPDNTDGAINYYDTSISFPASWGPQEDWFNTGNIGRLRFWRPVV